MASGAGAEVVRSMGRIGGRVVADRFRDTRARKIGDIPVRPKEFTAEWLTAVLCAGHPGVEVKSCEVAPHSSGTSDRLRVRVEYTSAESGLPTQLFAKTTDSVVQRLTLQLVDILPGEPGFFADIRPELDIEAAHGYYGAVDEKSGRSISLIEDLEASRGAVFSTPLTPVSRTDMEELLAGMARWHGRFWNDPALETRSYLKPPSQHYANLDRLIGMDKQSQVGARRAERVLPPGLAARHRELYAALQRSMELSSTGPATFLHGDSHIGNTYRNAEGRMGFTDWQVVLRGSWAYDVAYTMTSGLAVADRQAWERELIAYYLERLAEAGAAAPTFDEAWLAYRQQTLYPLYIWLTTRGHKVIQPKFQPDEVCEAIIERTAAAVVDLDPVAAIAAG